MSDNEDKKKEQYTRNKLFETLPDDKWDALTESAEHRVVPARKKIFGQGDPGDEFYIVVSGSVRVSKRDRYGLDRQLAVLGPRESFGQIPLLTGQVRSVDVETTEETHLMILTKEQFEVVLKESPEIALAVAKHLSALIVRAGKAFDRERQQQHRAERLTWFHVVVVMAIGFLLAVVFNQSNPNGIPLSAKVPEKGTVPTIRAVQAIEEIKKGDTLIVDAGPEGFYQRKHIRGAISVPLSLFDVLYEVTFEGEGKAKKVIVYGRTFSRLYDLELADRLIRKGRKDVWVLDGGAVAWEQAGYPVDIWEPKE